MDDNRQTDIHQLEECPENEALDVISLRKKLEQANERLKLYAVKDIQSMEQIAENETKIEELNFQILTLKEDRLKFDIYGKNWQLEKVKDDYRELERICQLQERQFNKAKNDMIELRRAFNLEKKELIMSKEELLTRFSKLAGSKLTQNNPGITDLSDSNRESKIAEQFSELYDTEWTEAFEELTDSGLKENEIIHVILDIVKTAYGVCCKLAEKYKLGIFESPSQLPVLGVIQQIDPDIKMNPEIELSDEIRSQLEDIRKALSPLFCESVEKTFLYVLRDTLPKSITAGKGGSTDVDIKKNADTPLSDELASENKGKKDDKENSGHNDVTYDMDENGIITHNDNNGTFIDEECTQNDGSQDKERCCLDDAIDAKDKTNTSPLGEVEGYDSSTLPNNAHICSGSNSDSDQEETNGQGGNDEKSSEHGNKERGGQQEAADCDKPNNEEQINGQQDICQQDDGEHGKAEKDGTKKEETEEVNKQNNIEIDATKRDNKDTEEKQKSYLDESGQHNIKVENSQQISFYGMSENLRTGEPQKDNYDTSDHQYIDEDDRPDSTDRKETKKKNVPKGNKVKDGQYANAEVDNSKIKTDEKRNEETSGGNDREGVYGQQNNIETMIETEFSKDNVEADSQNINKNAVGQQNSVEADEKHEKIVNDETENDNIVIDGQNCNKEVDGQQENASEEVRCENVEAEESQKDNIEAVGNKSIKQADNQQDSVETSDRHDKIVNDETQYDNIEPNGQEDKRDKNGEHPYIEERQKIKNTGDTINSENKEYKSTAEVETNGNTTNIVTPLDKQADSFQEEHIIEEKRNLISNNDKIDSVKCMSFKMEESFDINLYGKTRDFASKCARLCWLMRIKDPPLQLIWECTRGSEFNSDLFKHYTRSGQKTDFVVWPALLLHENGPLLAKGVAQAI